MHTKSDYPPGSLGARLVNARFYVAAPVANSTKSNINLSRGAETTLCLPSTLPVTRIMAVLLSEPAFRGILRPLQFRLVFESTELDPPLARVDLQRNRGMGIFAGLHTLGCKAVDHSLAQPWAPALPSLSNQRGLLGTRNLIPRATMPTKSRELPTSR